MPDATTLAVAALGDPRDPSTWSATPSNIVAALERKGLRVDGIDAGIRRRLPRARYFVRHQAGGLRTRLPADQFRRIKLLRTEARSDYQWAAPARAFRSDVVLRRLGELRATRVLHMSSLSLPLTPGGPVSHYLYCDSTWHTLRPPPQPSYRFSPAEYQAAASAERNAFRNVRHFFTTSEYVRDDLLGHYGVDPARVTAVGTGRGRMEPLTTPKSLSSSYILFCAKVNFEPKGGQLLLDAFSQAHRRNNALRLVLVGQESYAQMVKAMPGVKAHGTVPWLELQRLFHEAALFAMPALNEPWGIVYLEALASRTPILGLRRNALPEISGEGRFGFLVDEPEPAAVAAAMLDAFSDLDRLRSMGEQGQEFCLQRYSWDRVASEISSRMESDERHGRC